MGVGENPLSMERLGMRIPSPLLSALILRRLNRFAVQVFVEEQEAMAHLPNSGRLEELLQPGTPAYLVPRARAGRTTPFDLLLVRVGNLLVSVDARLPNRLVAEALRDGRLPPFQGYSLLQSEARYRGSRFDFLLQGPRGRCLLEAKSVTLVKRGWALFPDAPTERGRRHVKTLIAASRAGFRAALLFVIQRQDAEGFKPHDAADPAFGRLLRRAAAHGVKLLAYRCRVTTSEITLAEPVPVEL